jgi:succinate-semialdehyde dehydrogenase / glutarate-semialdehyde dehydrogenase
MELGGNAPFIVFEDADIDAAIEGAMIAKMRNMGEACTAANRFYVHEKVQDEFTKKLTAKMAALKMGNGLDDGVALGPLVNAGRPRQGVELVDDAVSKGAKILTGGKRRTDGLLLSRDRAVERARHAKMLNEEIFGPVASLQTFTDEAEVIRAPTTPNTASSPISIQGPEPRPARLREARLRHDRPQSRLVSDPAAPFGGMKQSGIGREGAHEGLMEFLETQYISVSW